MKIPVWRLRYAYEDDYVAFKAEWPDGMELTVPNLLRAVELEISIDWLAEKILDNDDRYGDVRRRAFLKIASKMNRAAQVLRDSGGTSADAAVFKDTLAPYLDAINLTLAQTLVCEAKYQEIAYGDET